MTEPAPPTADADGPEATGRPSRPPVRQTSRPAAQPPVQPPDESPAKESAQAPAQAPDGSLAKEDESPAKEPASASAPAAPTALSRAPGQPLSPAPSPAPVPALLDAALSKSGLVWVDVPGDRAWPAWHAWTDGTVYLVSGPGEQPLPSLPDQVEIVVRSKDSGGRLLRVRATTRTITPEDPAWDAATTALRAERLNAEGDPVPRWATANTVTALVPDPVAVEGPGSYDDGSGAAVPPPTPATTRSWAPFHWRGRPKVRRRRRG